ncbi:MAG: DUF3078 domain-containing protein [Prevotella sp.]|jgi:hypothetical protein
MKALFATIFCLFIAIVPAHSQRRGYDGYLRRLYSHYADSLRTLANDTTSNSTSTPIASYYRLFTPLSLYGSPMQHFLQPGEEPSEVDKALLHVYLNRPDLVKITEHDLSSSGGVETTNQVKARPDIVDIIAPKAQEPEEYPVAVVIKKPDFWTFSGDYNMQFLQNYVSSNWYKGGQSNYSVLGALTVEANYNNKQKFRFDNKLELKLGLQTTRDDSLHSFNTSEDLIRYTGKLGLQARHHWYYTLQTIAQTQFMRSYKSNDSKVYSDFFSPFILNISLGMDYNVNWLKQKLTGSIHLAPIAYNFKYVDRLSLSTRYGLDEGKHQLHDFGSEINIDLTYKFATNMKWHSRLYFYTTYERTEMEWENNVVLQINRFLSTNIFVYPRFDDGAEKDDHHGYWQLKEYCSFGFSFQL